MPNNVSFGVQAKGVKKASSEVDNLRDKFEQMKKVGAKPLLAGFAAGAAVKAFGLVEQGIDAVADALGDAVGAAQEEETSIQRLGTVLQANVKDWDGNTDAIEALLKKRIELGFSDDEQRDSLSKLVVSTKDVNKALELQRTAMDLARLKGIDLAAATDMVVKIQAGQLRGVKSLGIELKKGATAAEAMAAISKAAAGQAEEWANTNTGKLETSQVRINEAMETFGTRILPLVADAAVTAAGGIETVADAVDRINVTMPQGEESAGLFTGSFLGLFDVLGNVKEGFDELGGSISGMSDGSTEAVENLRGNAVDDLGTVGDATDDLGDDIRDLRRTTKTDTELMADYWDTLTKTLQDDVDTLQSEAFDPLEARYEKHRGHVQIVTAIEAREAAKGKEAVIEANSDIIDALDDQVDKLQDLGKNHKLTAEDVDQYEADIRAAYAAMGKKVPKEIQKVIDKLRTLAGFNGKSTTYTVHITSKGSKSTGGPKALGGPVDAGTEYLVGEHGPEKFVPDVPGTIIPNDKLKGGGNTYNYNVTVMGDIRARDKTELLRALSRLSSISQPMQGYGVF